MAEADIFCRQVVIPGHDQVALEAAHVAVIGAGGLGSWISMGLARAGVRRLTIIDPDRYDRTNAARQLLYPADIGQWKAHALARNIAPHMTNGASVRAIAAAYSRRLDDMLSESTILAVGIDNNQGRLDASAYGLARRIPVVFSMLSLDGLRAQVFRQEPGGACLSCVLPDLDPASLAPCAAASISSCFLAASYAVHAIIAAIGKKAACPLWREASLDGTADRCGSPTRSVNCTCHTA